MHEARTLTSSRPTCVAPEIDRLTAALSLQDGAESMVVEKHLRAALANAQDRQALALELRAATDLRRLSAPPVEPAMRRASCGPRSKSSPRATA